jgi:DNA-binding NarL/FixJ family response regulator
MPSTALFKVGHGLQWIKTHLEFLMTRPKVAPIRILLIDDHAVIRTAMRALITSQPGLAISGETGTHDEALQIASREHPDIVLLDLDLGEVSGLDLIPDLLKTSENSKIIVLTGVRDTELHHQAIRLGAMGVVRKEKAIDVLLEAINRVHAGEAWLDPSLMARVLSDVSANSRQKKADPETSKIATLTAREREVITLVCEGLKNKQISERLFISEWTVRHHITSIFSKLDCTDRVELILYAYRNGLGSPPVS